MSDISTSAYLLAHGEELGIFPTAHDAMASLLGAAYLDLPDEDTRLEARWNSAVATASQIQGRLLVEAASTGRWSPALEAEWTLTAMFQDKRVPYDLAEWHHPMVPLVTIVEDYAPFTDRARPQGNLLWLAVGDDRAFLESLDALGVLTLRVDDTI